VNLSEWTDDVLHFMEIWMNAIHFRFSSGGLFSCQLCRGLLRLLVTLHGLVPAHWFLGNENIRSECRITLYACTG
jgi:hypothetical protein